MLSTLVLLACNPPLPADTDDTDEGPPYALDDVLRLNHVQGKGTHNSYHVAESSPSDDLDYTHAPLDLQLDTQAVRHVELDIDQGNGPGTAILVRHIAFVDDEVTCGLLTECLGLVAAWSSAHPKHSPLLVLLEIKHGYDPDLAAGFVADLESEISAVFTADDLILPDDVQGGAANLSAAVAGGWPTLGELRGKTLIVFFGDNDWRRAYTEGDTTTAGRLMFPIGTGVPDAGVAVVHWIDDPVADATRIADTVAAGHLVRTRADADNVEPFAGDTSRAEAALASGAHYVSTDYPVTVDGVDYVFELPEGGPVRCNASTAPPECTTLAIEDPAHLVE
jgi:hypothetical protein